MEGARGYDGMIRVRRVRGPTLEVACTDELSGGTLQRIASSCISPLMQELAICIYNLGQNEFPSSKGLLRVSARRDAPGTTRYATTVKNTVEIHDPASIEPHPK